MEKISSIDEANAVLAAYVPQVAKLMAKDLSADRLLPLMHLLGDPHDKLRVVHIAGTSGKTSTAYYTAALLGAGGKKVGLTVSPHIDSVTERVQVDGEPLSSEKFCGYLERFLEIIRPSSLVPTYFELLTIFSLWVFAEEKVDYAVVETGLGGLHDTTNIITRRDKVCVITDIGFDHMHVLGNTLQQIARQKIGITHPGNTVIMYEQTPEVMEEVKGYVEQQGASLRVTNEPAERNALKTTLDAAVPDFQQRNWLLAHQAFQYIRQRDTLPELTPAQLTQAQHLQVPARMDVRKVGGKTIIMDGAHNGQKMHAFLESFQRRYPNQKPTVLVALKQGKEPVEVAPEIARLASRVIVTTFITSQDLPATAIDPQQLADIFHKAGANDVDVIPEQDQAYRALTAGTEKLCIITGSFYLLAQLRARAPELQSNATLYDPMAVK